MLRIALLLFVANPLFADKIVLVAGGGEGGENSEATKAKLIVPFGCDFDSKGRMFFVEFEKAHRLRVVEDGKVKTAAGAIEKGAPVKTKKPLEARFNGLHGITIFRQKSGDIIYLADTWNKCVRTLLLHTGEMVEAPSTGITPWGQLDQITFKSVFAVCLDQHHLRLVVTDLDRKQIFSWTVDGPDEEKVLAGTGTKAIPKDGRNADSEPLFDPRAATADSQGNLYILERSGHALRVVDKHGIIKTVAGTGKAGTAVGKALESQMNGPKHLCIDKDDNVIIADAENHRILKYDAKAQTVSVIVGTGKKGSAGLDGDPLKCELNRPHGVTVHPKTGELYICDSYNNRILKIVK